MAGLGGTIPNFDGLLDSDQPKDTEVTIVEEDGHAVEGSRKRSRQGTPDNHITVQAHWVVLRSLSPYFQAKLERWSGDGNDSKKPRRGRQQQQQQQDQQPPPYQYSLQLLVPPGQLELGRRLITAMYSSSPDLSDLGAPQLMQLVALAECYGVGKVVADAAAQLHKLSVESMPLDIAAAVFELPEACLALEAVQKVRQAATDKLQQELGDLEVAWGDKAKQQALLGLPFGALLQLLRDERTRVVSEDTAVYTAQRWLQAAGRDAVSQQQQQQRQQQLVGVLRLPHCTATGMARLAVDDSMGWVFNNSKVTLEALIAVTGRSSTEKQRWAMEVFFKDDAVWRLPVRPPSAVAQLELTWDIPLGKVEEGLAADPGEMVELNSSADVPWQARHWWLTLVYAPSSQQLEAYVSFTGAPACITARVWLEPAAGRQLAYGSPEGTLYVRVDWGGPVAQWGPGKEGWPAVKAWLQQQGLVHPDGCLHLRATITKVA